MRQFKIYISEIVLKKLKKVIIVIIIIITIIIIKTQSCIHWPNSGLIETNA